MTEEANAAIEAARGAGATEVVVADSHGNFQNLLPDKLPADVQVVRVVPAPARHDGGHRRELRRRDLRRLPREHYEPGRRARPQLLEREPGRRAPERHIRAGIGAWNAALAAHYGVPILAVSGDDAAVKEVQTLVGGGRSGREVAVCLPFRPDPLAREGATTIRDAVRAGWIAARNADRSLPRDGPDPSRGALQELPARRDPAWLPGVDRVDAHAVRYTVKDMPEASRFLAFVLNYQADLQP